MKILPGSKGSEPNFLSKYIYRINAKYGMAIKTLYTAGAAFLFFSLMYNNHKMKKKIESGEIPPSNWDRLDGTSKIIAGTNFGTRNKDNKIKVFTFNNFTFDGSVEIDRDVLAENPSREVIKQAMEKSKETPL